MNLFSVCSIIFLYSCFANADNVPFRARKIETLTILAFQKGTTGIPALYVDYLSNLICLWDTNKGIIDYSNLPLHLFFGNYNATQIFQDADIENSTAALNVLKNNDEFAEKMTTECFLADFTSSTKCEESPLCKYIQTFLNTPRDPLTKLNLLFVSNIFPDSSFFKDFYNFGESIGFKTTKTYLISASNSTWDQSFKYPDYQFIPDFTDNDYSYTKRDTEILADPTFEFDSKYADSDMFVTINETQYKKAIKSIAAYYKKYPMNYILTLTIENITGSKKSQQIVTVIPKVNYITASFTVEEYLKQNCDYFLNRNENKNDGNFDTEKSVEISNSMNVVVFSNDNQKLKRVKKYVSSNSKSVKYIQI